MAANNTPKRPRRIVCTFPNWKHDHCFLLLRQWFKTHITSRDPKQSFFFLLTLKQSTIVSYYFTQRTKDGPISNDSRMQLTSCHCPSLAEGHKVKHQREHSSKILFWHVLLAMPILWYLQIDKDNFASGQRRN